jgi:uncharacterized protein YkwD
MLEIAQRAMSYKEIRRVVNVSFALLSAYLIIALLLLNSFAGSAQSSTGGLSTSEFTRITNEARAQKGLVSLTYNSVLAQAAQARAQHMIDNNYFGHSYNGVGGLDIKEIQKLGYGEPTGFIGENIYANTANLSTIGKEYNQTIMTGWLNSKPHYDNIMYPTHRLVGFGWAYAPAGSPNKWHTVVVAIHANALPPRTTPAPAPVQPTPQPAPAPIPSAEATLACESSNATSITLRATTANTTNARIVWNVTSSERRQVGQTLPANTTTSTSRTQSDLSPSTTYRFQVRNSSNNGEVLAQVRCTTKATTPAPVPTVPQPQPTPPSSTAPIITTTPPPTVSTPTPQPRPTPITTQTPATATTTPTTPRPVVAQATPTTTPAATRPANSLTQTPQVQANTTTRTQLPNTGAGDMLAILLGISLAGYFTSLRFFKP